MTERDPQSMFETSSAGTGRSKAQISYLAGAVGSALTIVGILTGYPPPMELAGPIAALIFYIAGIYQRRAIGQLKKQAQAAPAHQARPEPALTMPKSSQR